MIWQPIVAVASSVGVVEATGGTIPHSRNVSAVFDTVILTWIVSDGLGCIGSMVSLIARGVSIEIFGALDVFLVGASHVKLVVGPSLLSCRFLGPGEISFW